MIFVDLSQTLDFTFQKLQRVEGDKVRMAQTIEAVEAKVRFIYAFEQIRKGEQRR